MNKEQNMDAFFKKNKEWVSALEAYSAMSSGMEELENGRKEFVEEIDAFQVSIWGEIEARDATIKEAVDIINRFDNYTTATLAGLIDNLRAWRDKHGDKKEGK